MFRISFDWNKIVNKFDEYVNKNRNCILYTILPFSAVSWNVLFYQENSPTTKNYRKSEFAIEMEKFSYLLAVAASSFSEVTAQGIEIHAAQGHGHGHLHHPNKVRIISIRLVQAIQMPAINRFRDLICRFWTFELRIFEYFSDFTQRVKNNLYSDLSGSWM